MGGKHLPWLSWWSLLAFCSHKAVYYVIGGRPWGISVVLSSIVPFYAVWLACACCQSKRKDARLATEGAACCGHGDDEENSAGAAEKRSNEGEEERIEFNIPLPAVEI